MTKEELGRVENAVGVKYVPSHKPEVAQYVATGTSGAGSASSGSEYVIQTPVVSYEPTNKYDLPELFGSSFAQTKADLVADPEAEPTPFFGYRSINSLSSGAMIGTALGALGGRSIGMYSAS